MHNISSVVSASIRQSRCKIVILILWTLGLVLGLYFAVYASDYFSSMMLGLSDMPMSIVGLLVGALMPFLIGTVAVALELPWLLYIVSFGKSFAFGFCAAGIELSYGSSAWLARCVWMFTDLCAMPLVLLFLLRAVHGVQNKGFLKLWMFPALVLMILWLDHSVISPFGALIG